MTKKNKTSLYFVRVITKPENVLRDHIQIEKLRNCVYIFKIRAT